LSYRRSPGHFSSDGAPAKGPAELQLPLAQWAHHLSEGFVTLAHEVQGFESSHGVFVFADAAGCADKSTKPAPLWFRVRLAGGLKIRTLEGSAFMKPPRPTPLRVAVRAGCPVPPPPCIQMEKIVPLPTGFTTAHTRHAFVITRRWYKPYVFLLLFFALFWNGFMVVWMTMAFSREAWAMVAFGLLHAAVGFGLIYYVIATFLNRTDISTDPNHLTVRHFPVPWFGNKKLDVLSIKQLYTKQHVRRSNNREIVTFRLFAVTEDNREHELLTGLSDPGQAEFVESEIEAILQIDDRPVAGEFDRHTRR
jgi:hypothetical protein